MLKQLLIVFVAFFGAAVTFDLRADTELDEKREEKRGAILAELEGTVPVWAGSYRMTSVDAIWETCIAPENGVALVSHHAPDVWTISTADILGFSQGRLSLRWDKPRVASKDICIVTTPEYAVLVDTGDIHRFFIEFAENPNAVKFYPHRKIAASDRDSFPDLPPEIEAFRKKSALYGEVTRIDKTTFERIIPPEDGSGNRGRSYLKLTQEFVVDFGTDQGIFHGLVLYPAVVGSDLRVEVVSVESDHCVCRIETRIKRRRPAIHEGDLLTTGRVTY